MVWIQAPGAPWISQISAHSTAGRLVRERLGQMGAWDMGTSVGKTKERPWHVELPEQNPPASAGTQAPRSMGCFYPTEVDGHTGNLQEVKLLPEGWLSH